MLLARLVDPLYSASLRSLLLVPLVALLHLPEGMRQFVSAPYVDAAASADTSASTSYQRLLAMMTEPLSPLVLEPLQRIFTLAAAWNAAVVLIEASEAAMHAECTTPPGRDAVALPVLRALVELGHSIGALVAAPSRQRARVDHLAALARPALTSAHSPVSQLPPGLAPSTPDCDEAGALTWPQARLLSGAGIWHGLVATLSAPAVRASSLLSSITASVVDILDSLLSCFGGALSLAAESEVAAILLELLPLPSVGATQPADGVPGVEIKGEGALKFEPDEPHVHGRCVLKEPSWAMEVGRRLSMACTTVQVRSAPNPYLSPPRVSRERTPA